MAKYDLYNLPDDVLFLSKEDFNDLVVEICGKSEANLLKVQGIQNAQSLIRCMNIFSILDIDCDEVNNLKSIVCFQSRNGDYVVKQGVQLNLDNLVDTLKAKHDKYKKKKKHQSGSALSYSSIIPTTNSIDTNTSLEAKSNEATASTITSSTTNSNQLSCESIHDHMRFIQDLIEKFSQKTFSIVFKNDEHYHLKMTQIGQNFNALIKCQCGAKLTLPSRSKTKTFILSNYYAHLTTTNCSMIDRINKQEKMKNNNEIQQQPSISGSPKRATVLVDSSQANTNSNKRQKKNYQN